MPSQDIGDHSKERQIWDYAKKFTRSSLVPSHPLHRLTGASPISHSRQTSIRRERGRVVVPIGTTGHLEIPTIILRFNIPRWILNCPALGAIHVPEPMWSDREPSRSSPSAQDDRAADLQIGDSDVRSAINYHIVAWWRASGRQTDPSTTNPLFGQILLRQFASFTTERLRSFVFEVPGTCWILDGHDLSGIRLLLWDAGRYKVDDPSYKGPLGRFFCSFSRGTVSFEFEVRLELPGAPSILWETSMPSSDLGRGLDYVRNEVVAKISLEADPPIQLRYPQDGHLDSLGVPDGSFPNPSA